MSSIEEAREQGGKDRLQCFEKCRRILTDRYLHDTVLANRNSIVDFLDKSLRRGSTQNRVATCSLISLLCIQLGRKESTEIFTLLKPHLVSILHDLTCAPSLRSCTASTLGISCFIGAETQDDIRDCVEALQRVFSQKVPDETATHVVFSSSLISWSLLFGLLNFETASYFQIDDVIRSLCHIIERGDLSLRITAGETVSLLYELVDDIGDHGPAIEAYELLRNLSNESGHQKGKREKRVQKSYFREIVKFIEDGCLPDKEIGFGAESLVLSSWNYIVKYKALKETLGSGMNEHLQSNPLLRDVFGLGERVCEGDTEEKTDKREKEWTNAANVKARKKNRNKERDDKLADLYEL